MLRWCEVNRKHPSRRRFINWINKCDRPMIGAAPQAAVASTFWQDQKHLELVTRELAQIEDRIGRDPLGSLNACDQQTKDRITKLRSLRLELKQNLGLR